jgi:hypothetical protein
MAMRPDLDCNEMSGLSLTSAFNKDLFHLESHRVKYESTQAVPADQFTTADKYINMALLYLYRKATVELKAFHSAEALAKIGVEIDGVILSKGRIMQGMEFLETAELDLDLGSLGLRNSLPVLDRYSPLSYSIAQHVHWRLAPHRGAETCNRVSLENVQILQGASLYRELGEQCLGCAMKRKRYLEAAFGPIRESQLAIAPPFWFAQMDLLGPVKVYAPGRERNTRSGLAALDAKCWIMVIVCPTTRLINMQVLERCLADAIISGMTRLGCEIGVPKKLFIDQAKAIECGLENVEFDMRGVQHQLKREHGIEFEVCPVAGHNQHGHVERVIRSVQESFNDCGLLTKRYNATSLQTLAKLVENQYNNLPLGYHHHETAGGNPVLKMITPNHLRMGRMNKRVLDGPMRLPRNREEQLEVIAKMYNAWFRIWRDTYVPKLMHQPIWFRSDRDLMEGDLVYFVKRESEVGDAKWTLGMVDELHRGRDGIIREAVIKYCNATEQKLSLTKGDAQDSTYPRYTERAVRRLVKIFSIEEDSLADDLAELSKKFQADKETENDLVDLDAIAAEVMDPRPEGRRAGPKPEWCKAKNKMQGECCCQEHCNLTKHYDGHVKMEIIEKEAIEVFEVEVTEDEPTECVTDVFSSVNLDVEAVFNL